FDIVQIVTCIVFITLGIILNHRDFSPLKPYRIRATDFSIIWYTSFLFLLPLGIKFILSRLKSVNKYRRVFIFHYFLAILTSITPIYIMLEETSIKSAEKDYQFNFDSDQY